MADHSKILFIVNPGSGNSKTDWPKEIDAFFAERQMNIEQFELPEHCEPSELKNHINKSGATTVVAVGGDGTVKLVAEMMTDKNKRKDDDTGNDDIIYHPAEHPLR